MRMRGSHYRMARCPKGYGSDLKTAAYVLILLLPPIAWSFADRSISGDGIDYAARTLELYLKLAAGSPGWADAILSVSKAKPPLINWAGIVVVPLGIALDRMEFALRLPILFALFVSLFILMKVLSVRFGGPAAYAGCALAASSPIFIIMSAQI